MAHLSALDSQRLRSCRALKYGVLTLALATTAPAYTMDSLSLEAGTGNQTRLLRVGIQRAWDKNWTVLSNARLSGYWDISLAGWHGKRHQDRPDRQQTLVAVGLTPVFRLSSKEQSGPYLELGVGPHLLSKLYDNNRRQLSTRFQFGSHLGIGYMFENGLDLALRYQHYSNASIKKPNDGVNYTIVRFAYPF